MSVDAEVDAQDAREQVLRLIDYLAEYDAQRNKPVRNISDYRLFRLSQGELSDHEAVQLRPNETDWKLQRTFNRAASRAVRAGMVARIDDGVPGLVHATLHMPGEDPVRLRRLGPRTIFEVPKSELQALFALLSAKGVSEDDMDREVLNALGLKRLTERTTTYLQECRDYTWGVS